MILYGPLCLGRLKEKAVEDQGTAEVRGGPAENGLSHTKACRVPAAINAASTPPVQDRVSLFHCRGWSGGSWLWVRDLPLCDRPLAGGPLVTPSHPPSLPPVHCARRRPARRPARPPAPNTDPPAVVS